MEQDVVIKNNILNNTPFLTIGIINYNYGKFLRHGFEAIQRQKFRDIELIYADNGSTDNSQNIICELMNKTDIPIRFITGKNVGVCGNRNRILKHAKGKYLMMCDADDWITDNCLELLCKRAMETNADQIVGEYRKVDKNGKVFYQQTYPKGAVKWSVWVHHATIYKMEVIKKNNIQFAPNWLAEDVCFNSLFHKYSSGISFVHSAVENWYKHNDSLTSMCVDKTKNINGLISVEKTAPFLFEIWKEIPKTDQEQLEYMWSMIYYYEILYRRPAKRFKDDFEEYKKIHQIMLKFFPDYLHNIILWSPFGKGFYRKNVTIPIFFLAFIERINLMKPALWGYWVLSHVYKLKF